MSIQHNSQPNNKTLILIVTTVSAFMGAFIVFAALCVAGIFASLARGKTHHV